MKKLKNWASNLLINAFMRVYGYKIINMWVYFTLNYPCMMKDGVRGMFENLYGENLGVHFYEKFDYFYDSYGSRAVIHRIWSEMSPQYRKTLMNHWFLKMYVKERYHNDWERS